MIFKFPSNLNYSVILFMESQNHILDELDLKSCITYFGMWQRGTFGRS